MTDDVIGKLREAVAEYDGASPDSEPGFRAWAALNVVRLARELLAEIDGEAEDVWVAPPGTPVIALGAEPLGGPVPGVTGHLPGDES